MNNRRLKISYLLGRYPLYSENFVYREIDSLRQLGVDINILSLRKGENNNELNYLKNMNVFYPYPQRILQSLLGNCFWIISHPCRYSQIVFLILKQIRKFPLTTVFKQFIILYLTPSLLAAIKKNNPYIIHAHFSNGSTTALFCNMLADKKYSFTLHAFDDLYSNAIFLNNKIENAEFVVCESRYNNLYVKDLISTNFYNKINTVYCGVYLRNIAAASHRGRKIRILSIGRLVKHKGFKTLVEAIRILFTNNMEFEVNIVGDGALRNELSEIITRFGLDKNVNLLGVRNYENLEKLYLNSDLFVLTPEIQHNGERDGLPNVLIEAMSFGLPVISTYVSAIPELITNNVNGILVPERDAKSLAEAIIYLIRNPNKAKELATNGHKTISENFNIENTSNQLKNLLMGTNTAS